MGQSEALRLESLVTEFFANWHNIEGNKMENNLNSRELIQEARKKKAYQPPQLFIYGNIREITQTVGQHGSIDGGGPPNQKTAP